MYLSLSVSLAGRTHFSGSTHKFSLGLSSVLHFICCPLDVCFIISKTHSHPSCSFLADVLINPLQFWTSPQKERYLSTRADENHSLPSLWWVSNSGCFKWSHYSLRRFNTAAQWPADHAVVSLSSFQVWMWSLLWVYKGKRKDPLISVTRSVCTLTLLEHNDQTINIKADENIQQQQRDSTQDFPPV